SQPSQTWCMRRVTQPPPELSAFVTVASMSLSVCEARTLATGISQMFFGGIEPAIGYWPPPPSGQFGGTCPIGQRPQARRAELYPHPRQIESTVDFVEP